MCEIDVSSNVERESFSTPSWQRVQWALFRERLMSEGGKESQIMSLCVERALV